MTNVLGVILSIKILGRNMSAAYKMPWVILLLTFPFAGVPLILLFDRVRIPNKHLKRFKKFYELTENSVKSPADIIDDKAALSQSNYILNTCHLPAFSHCYNEFLPTGEEFFSRLEEELKKAEKYIFMEYFIVEQGALWTRIHNILLEKVKAGVEVHFMYDDIGSITKLPRRFYKRLVKEGIKACVFNKFIPIVSAVHNNRDHRKITVIDGKVAFTGGANIADEYTNEREVFGKWNDAGILIKGEAVDSFVALFVQMYNSSVSDKLDVNQYIVNEHEIYDAVGFVQPYGDGPRPISNDYVGRDVYLNIINQARDYIYITTPYLVVEHFIIEALCNAAKRGVDVRIMTPNIPDKKTIFIMTQSCYLPLIKAGVKIYQYKPGFIHAKTMVADDIIGTVGTINLDYRSFCHHFECGVWMYKTASISSMKVNFLTLVKNDGIEIDEKNAKLNPFKRLVKDVLYVLAPLL